MARGVRLIRSPISVTGMVLTTVSAVTFLVVFLADLFGFHSNPYIGILFFLILPGIFLVGLALIPLGAWVERRRLAGRGPADWPRLDLNVPAQRRTAVMIFALTMVNVIIVSLAAYRGVEYMDSVAFCGQVCHQAMQPEFVAHETGPHARVACIACHIGPGASSFAQSKISGMRQLVALTRGTYARPIPAPVENMRSAREVCEQCHWPEKYYGDKLVKVTEYGDDAANTESTTTLQVHVGGGSRELGIATGIHWHMNVANEVEYIASDDKREVIPYVRVKDLAGNVREYFGEGTTPGQVPQGERRRMDCLDCHNRPSHTIATTAERAVDGAIALDEIPKTLPFVRREIVKAVKGTYPSREAAFEQIAGTLRGFYQNGENAVDPSRRGDVDKAVAGAQAVYGRNVFPAMNVAFGTYANNIGHVDSPGCFRCHDDNHKTADGRTIGQECDTCHAIE